MVSMTDTPTEQRFYGDLAVWWGSSLYQVGWPGVAS